MAQDFVGSGNNAPLLEAIGQFGTRLQVSFSLSIEIRG